MLKINICEKLYLAVVRPLFTIIVLLGFSINSVINAMLEPYNYETDAFAYEVFNLDPDKDFDQKPLPKEKQILPGQVIYEDELNSSGKSKLSKEFKKLSLIFHPDRLLNNTPLVRKIGEEIFRSIASAKSMLEHPDVSTGISKFNYFKDYKSLIKKFEAAKANHSKPIDLNALKSELQDLSDVINSLANVSSYKPNNAKKSESFPQNNNNNNNNNVYNIKSVRNNVVQIKLIKGDILSVKADAIVNAANEECLGGGGIDGYITSNGGPALAEARRNIPIAEVKEGEGIRCPLGSARITRAGNLNYKDQDTGKITNFKYVVHAVGPHCASTQVMSIKEKNDLAVTYTSTIYRVLKFNEDPKNTNFVEFPKINISDLGQNYKIESISFPTISTGIYRCTTEQSAKVVIEAVVQYLQSNLMGSLKTINFVFWDTDKNKMDNDFNNYKKALDDLNL